MQAENNPKKEKLLKQTFAKVKLLGAPNFKNKTHDSDSILEGGIIGTVYVFSNTKKEFEIAVATSDAPETRAHGITKPDWLAKPFVSIP